MTRRTRTHGLAALALLAALLAARPAAAAPAKGGAKAGHRDTVYSYVNEDGVLVVTNVPGDARYKTVRQIDTGGGLYATSTTRPAGGGGSPARLETFAGHIRDAAARHNVPEALIKAVMSVESNFDPRALSDKGAMGLMQLMPATARDLNVRDAWDPVQNIDGGTRYLRELADRYEGDFFKIVAAYNAGPEAVRRAGAAVVPNYPETQEYVRKVVERYWAYKAGR